MNRDEMYVECERCRAQNVEHPLLYDPPRIAAVGVEQCLLWGGAGERRRRPGDEHDRLCHEIAKDWRTQRGTAQAKA